MEEREKDDPLWKLLEQFPPVAAPSPTFVRDLVRMARHEPQQPLRKSWRDWLALPVSLSRPRLLWVPALATAVAVLTATWWMTSATTEAPSYQDWASWGMADPVLPESEMEDFEYFAQLMAVADPTSLEDEMLLDLLF